MEWHVSIPIHRSQTRSLDSFVDYMACDCVYVCMLWWLCIRTDTHFDGITIEKITRQSKELRFPNFFHWHRRFRSRLYSSSSMDKDTLLVCSFWFFLPIEMCIMSHSHKHNASRHTYNGRSSDARNLPTLTKPLTFMTIDQMIIHAGIRLHNRDGNWQRQACEWNAHIQGDSSKELFTFTFFESVFSADQDVRPDRDPNHTIFPK